MVWPIILRRWALSAGGRMMTTPASMGHPAKMDGQETTNGAATGEE
jgi:hypothetical protein